MQMQTMKAQRGITLIGFIMLLAVIGVFLFVGFKLFPVYAEYYSAVTDLKAICKEPDAPNASMQDVRNKLDRRFNVSYVESINTAKDVKIITEGDTKLVNIKYEVRRPLIYNLDFVAKFDVSEPLIGGGTGGQ